MKKHAVNTHRENLLNVIPELSVFIDSFSSITKQWTGAITAGMIETGRMEAEAAQLFGPLIKDMRITKEKYGEIQKQFVDVILFEMAKKVVSEITDAAQFAINILKRNLFERTADVGYLATDVEIVNFLKLPLPDGTDEEDPDGRTAFMHRRLQDYQSEYTVYNDIIIVDLQGKVRINLDRDNPITVSKDTLLDKTQEVDLHVNPGEEKFLETFRPSDLRPGAGNVLIYSQKIEDPESRQSLGTLCLCFDFEDEMNSIYKDLAQSNGDLVVAILNENGDVLSANFPGTLPLATRIPIDLNADFRFLSRNGSQYLISTVATDGYQGFYGLTWYGMVMIDAKKAFNKAAGDGSIDRAIIEKVRNFSKELSAVKYSSDELLDDMKIDNINGKIQAQFFSANSFVEVLNFINSIGKEINLLFSNAIENLQHTVVTSLFIDVQFRAFQGNNIADRNLYERANDVCWWALSPLFRDLLSKNEKKPINDKERQELTETLQYINNLYTPYLRLVLADTKGCILATSHPPSDLEERFEIENAPKGQEFIGMQLDETLIKKAVKLSSRRDYCVSDFEPSFLYGGRPTYIYSTAIRKPDDEKKIVGVIQIVFDSEPQFQAMLEDVLPKNDQGEIIEGCFGVFTDRKKTIISSTTDQYPVGGKLNLKDSFFTMKNGKRSSFIVELDSHSYVVGLQVANGYREFKNIDNYINDTICLVFVPI
jgi:hypothetical protein